MAWRTWALLKERFKTLELIHCQNKIPKGGASQSQGGGANAPPAPPERNPDIDFLKFCLRREVLFVRVSQR